MSTETVLVSEFIPATRERLYAAWLDSQEHSAFTDEVAAIEPFVGGSHSAFSGYATGQLLELEPNRRIVATWRSTDFPDEADDSRLEVTFEDTSGGTMVTLLHTGIPSGQSDRYRDSWVQYYLQRMKKYFGGGDDESSDGVSDGVTEIEVTVSGTSGSDEFDADAVTRVATSPPPLPPPRARRPPVQSGKSGTKPAQAAKSARKRPAAARAKPATSKAKPAAKGKASAAARRQAGGKPAAKAGGKAMAKAGGKPMAKAGGKPTAKAGGKPMAKAGGKPTAKGRAKTARKPAPAKRPTKKAGKPSKRRGR
jgi:uncharacterized protein YndB with AHSA1/START domain